MFCKDCGREMQETASFCGGCGTKVEQKAVSPTPIPSGEDGQQELLAWSKSDLSSDDIIFETESELSNTPAARQSMVFDLLRAGLLNDENGVLANGVRRKILDVLGFNNFAGFFADREGMPEDEEAGIEKLLRTVSNNE